MKKSNFLIVFISIFIVFVNLAKADSIINFNDNIESSKKDSITLAQNATKEIKTQKKIKNEVVNGATFIAVTSDKNPQNLKLNKKTYRWVAHPTDSEKKIAFVSISYYEKPKSLNLGDNITLEIKQGEYKKEKIKIQDKSKVTPDNAASKRIKAELDEANKIYNTYDKTRYWREKFGLPLEKIDISSPFGGARVYNDGAIKSYHAGTDMRAVVGTSVFAVNDGVVVLAKERYLAGGSVIVSHGEGVFSMYYHLSEFNVKVGDKVKKGQIVAKSGNTGRSSAPHLHLSMMVNGTLVDPFDFMDKINALIEK
ncbi:peptidoglycan DD-metalloendopeptidase family protein [Helicobacter saguini]|uniref:M23 family metallopeptidase n=1 Tax=Helicobacter saguini TaxID=1548018 RepID=A0A347W0H9_9HELI|nr:M23 family metallopeptidase [Helicobacter saguini]MWV62338.1 peptidoglycan DD-metalloendopeptidase family protein [Helicobacter saguini]MWV66991.1 peptidoglycan DD-metalloendopeptidase family protein [Helicobacter saguini]MWV69339.1 peptidoglycan DD-metalloendopeptidase family protein [Helicobacter saguini]MWV71106.1 peptidoglycan DD-metalloendopeptidase family protein [Helicobacter saguini]TLD94998.1 M23 family metallopeptidase [Helicobacter saguini]